MLVEGQGSLDHPAYSSVTLGLIHGATPHAMVMVHKPGLADHDFDHLPDRTFPIAPLPGLIDLHERIAAVLAPSTGGGGGAQHVARYPDDADAHRIIGEIAAETGLPCDDPVRFGPGRLWAEIAQTGERPAGMTSAQSRSVPHLGFLVGLGHSYESMGMMSMVPTLSEFGLRMLLAQVSCFTVRLNRRPMRSNVSPRFTL